MKKKICFSIVSHHQSDLVNLLLMDIEKNVSVKEYDLEIVITDNFGEKDWEPSITCYNCDKISNLRKKGFGSNHNAAFEKSNPDFFFVINPDVRITSPIFFDVLIMEMEDQTIYTPKIINKSGDLEDFSRKNLTLLNLIRRRFGLKESGSLTWFAGIFHGYTASTFRSLKGFDPGYYMYVEDTDICYRNQSMGGNLKVFDNFKVVHNAQRQTLRRLGHAKWHIASLGRFFLKKLGLISEST